MLTFEVSCGPFRLHFSMGDPPADPEREYVPAALTERAESVLNDPVPVGEPVERIGFRATRV